MNDALHEAVQDCVRRHGAHLIDLVVRGGPRRRLIQVFVDAEESITLERCTAISREVTAAIEGGTILKGDYRLEVSSPGIDRPLAHAWQYPKHVGRTLRVKTRRAGEPTVVEGRLAAADVSGIDLELSGAPAPIRIVFEEIVEARVRSPW